MQSFFNAQFPGNGLRVEAFGSSVTGLYGASSDVDLVILDPSRPLGVGSPPGSTRNVGPAPEIVAGLPTWYNVNNIAKRMRRNTQRRGLVWRNLLPISGANVPIVSFDVDHPRSGTTLSVDINVNNRFGLA